MEKKLLKRKNRFKFWTNSWSLNHKRTVLTQKLFFLLGVTLLTVLFFSQIIKLELLSQQQRVVNSPLESSIINITVEENNTFLFGLINNSSKTINLLMLIFQFLLITGFLITIFWSSNFWIQLFLAIIIVGALGNSINRIWNDGKVVDYIKITFKSNYINFNLEDFLIFMGIVGLFIVWTINIFSKKNKW